MRIRNLHKEDIAACLSIYNWYIEHTTITFETEPLSLQAFRERIENITRRYPWLVAEDTEHTIVGYAYLDTFNARSAYDYTCDVSIYLDYEQRYHGTGTILMQALLDLAKEDGYHTAVSIVTQGNEPSEHLHEKCGFTKAGVLEDTGYKFEKWLSVTYYVKSLQKGDPHPLKNKEYV